MILVLLGIAAVVFAICRGLDEGMDMTQAGDGNNATGEKDGVRENKWFGAYHAVGRVSIISGIATGFLWAFHPLQGALLLLALSPWLWELTELTYAFTRYARLLPDEENVMGVWRVKGDGVFWIHLYRLLAGFAFVPLFIAFG